MRKPFAGPAVVRNRSAIYTYGGRGADQWWEKNLAALARLNNLAVMNLPLDGSRALATLAQPSMQLQCTIQEGQIWMADGKNTVHIELTILKRLRPRLGSNRRTFDDSIGFVWFLLFLEAHNISNNGESDASRRYLCPALRSLTSSPARGTGCTIIRTGRTHASSITERPPS